MMTDFATELDDILAVLQARKVAAALVEGGGIKLSVQFAPDMSDLKDMAPTSSVPGGWKISDAPAPRTLDSFDPGDNEPRNKD